VLVIGISGACRCDEMVKMRTDDFEVLGSLVLVKIPDSKTKKPRSFTIVGDKFMNVYRKYISLRPENMKESRFFLKYVNGKCCRAVMGLHKIGGVPKEVALFLKLPNCSEYTGHSLRRTSATLLVDGGADITSLKRHGGWTSSTIAEGYIEESLAHKQDVAMKILCPNTNVVTPEVNALGPPSSPTAIEITDVTLSKVAVTASSSAVAEAMSAFNIQNSSNCIFNLNFYK
jgi:integrase